jgi:alkylated DNA repair dioxygenase AlkB
MSAPGPVTDEIEMVSVIGGPGHPDGDVRLVQGVFFEPGWYDQVLVDVPLRGHQVQVAGRVWDEPRRSCWVGDVPYRYSGVTRAAQPWPAVLGRMRARCEAVCQDLGVPARFNGVLVNWYRDGRDSMGWHADDEPELGTDPVIASVSLGAVRRFVLRRRDRTDRVVVDLEPGSVLVMAGATQRHWLHQVPRTARVVAGRVNCTFRRVGPPGPGRPGESIGVR